MDKIYKKARAKINLTLNVVNKRSDGYHNLESVFQIINLYDEIIIEKTNDNSFKLSCSKEAINNETNIIYKAYELLKKNYSKVRGVKVTLIKNIPMQAGLGGGSADCAQFILGINELFELNLSKQEIIDLGKKLGADVVPCLHKQAVLGQGIGDIVTKIDTTYKYYVLIMHPNINCDTKYQFKILDKRYKDIVQDFNSKTVIQGLENNNISKIANNLYNIFEQTIQQKEQIQEMKSVLLQNGAKGALLAGSGSCVFGIFDNKQEVIKAYRALKENYEVYLTVSYNNKKGELG